jgi:hypothetical protein
MNMHLLRSKNLKYIPTIIAIILVILVTVLMKLLITPDEFLLFYDSLSQTYYLLFICIVFFIAFFIMSLEISFSIDYPILLISLIACLITVMIATYFIFMEGDNINLSLIFVLMRSSFFISCVPGLIVLISGRFVRLKISKS